MSKHLLSPLPLLLIFFLQIPIVFAQSPAPAPAPSPSEPPKILAILKKAGDFNKLIRLIKKTNMDDRILSLLSNSNPLTIFAPTDEAFEDLDSDTLKSLTLQQKIQLVQFHVINSLIASSDFQTVSNPLSTQAGDNNNYHFPMNVTVSGNEVNITTGVVNASVTGTVYTDNLLAVYKVDQVLLPQRFFVSPPPIPPPPSKPVLEEAQSPDSTEDTDSSGSGVASEIHHGLTAMSIVGSVVSAFCFCL